MRTCRLGVKPLRYTINAESDEKFTTLGACDATLLAVVVNAARCVSRRLFLTRISGGAFGNEETWISSALLRALRLNANQGIEVRMVSYGPIAPRSEWWKPPGRQKLRTRLIEISPTGRS